MREFEKNPNEYYYSYFEIGGKMVRRTAAEFLGCDVEETTLMQSTTASINTVADGLVASGYLKSGDRVLMTDQEHCGGLAGWKFHVNATGIVLDRAAIPVYNATAEAAVRAIQGKLGAAGVQYKVVAIPHVLTTTGFRMPLRQIADLSHSHGAYLVVDGAQGPGGINVNFRQTDADAYATSSHKWQLAPKGSAVLCMKKSFKSHVKSTYLFGEEDKSLPSFGIKLSSSGTQPAHTIAGQGAAFDYLSAFGMDNVEGWNLRLRQMAVLQMQGLGLQVLGGLAPEDTSPMLCVALPRGVAGKALSTRLFLEYGIFAKPTGRAEYPDEWPAGSPAEGLRFSFHVFNTEADVAKLARALGRALGPARAAPGGHGEWPSGQALVV